MVEGVHWGLIFVRCLVHPSSARLNPHEPQRIHSPTPPHTPDPDFTQFDKDSKYFDAASSPENVRWMMVDVQLKRKLPGIISLEDLKAHKEGALSKMILLQRSR